MDSILSAARHVFSDKGYESASMAEIGSCVGVSEATIYKYFDSKRSLLLSVIQDWFLGMIAGNRDKVAGVYGVRSRVHLLIWQHLNTIRDASDLCRLFYAEVRSRPDYVGSKLHSLNREATQLLTLEIDVGIATGLIRSDIPVRLVRDIVFGGIEHHVSAFLAGHGQLDCDAIADSMTSILFEGVQARKVSVHDAIERIEHVAERLERALGPKPVRRGSR